MPYNSYKTYETSSIGCGCIATLLSIAFWAVIIYVVFHFLIKFW